MRGEGMAWPETAPTVKTLYVNPAVDRTWRLPKYRTALVRPDHNFIPCRGKAASMIYYQWNADMHASGGRKRGEKNGELEARREGEGKKKRTCGGGGLCSLFTASLLSPLPPRVRIRDMRGARVQPQVHIRLVRQRALARALTCAACRGRGTCTHTHTRTCLPMLVAGFGTRLGDRRAKGLRKSKQV